MEFIFILGLILLAPFILIILLTLVYLIMFYWFWVADKLQQRLEELRRYIET